MRRAVAVAVLAGLVVVALVAVLVVRWAQGDEPMATGRDGDACPASGPAGLVGVDLTSGDVRWTNVVGEGVARVWVPAAEVDGGRSARVLVAGDDGSLRTVSAATGAVAACPDGADLPQADHLWPPAVDPSGATAVDRAVSAVEVREADGSTRWAAADRALVGASTGGVVVRSDVGRDGFDDCCDDAPDVSVEVLDPATGEVRWAEELQGLSGVVTTDHLVLVDQFPRGLAPVGPEGPGALGPARVTAYDLIDGTEVWRFEAPGTPSEVFAVGGLVLVPGSDQELVAVDERSGAVRWRAELPDPGRGGPYTDGGYVTGVARSGDVLAVVVLATAPYRD